MKSIIICNNIKYIELPIDKRFYINEELKIVDKSNMYIDKGGIYIDDKNIEEEILFNKYSIKIYNYSDEGKRSFYNKDRILISSEPEADIVIDKQGIELIIENGILKVIDGDVYINAHLIRESVYSIKGENLIFIAGIKIMLHKDYLDISGEYKSINMQEILDNYRHFPTFPVYKRGPRIIVPMPDNREDIKQPKTKEDKPKFDFAKRIAMPILTMLMTIGVSILLKRGMYVLMSIGAFILSIVFAVYSSIQEKKEFKLREQKRLLNYEKYILKKRKILHDLYMAQKKSLNYHYPSIKVIERMLVKYSDRIYERSNDESDFLCVSLGNYKSVAAYKIDYKEDLESLEEEELKEEAKSLYEKYISVDNVPRIIDLKNTNLGLVGEKVYIHKVLKSLLYQLCFFHSYHDLEIIMFIDEEYKDNFQGFYYYPHFKLKDLNVKTLVYSDNHSEQVLSSISSILKSRKQKLDEEKKDIRFLPHYIFIIDNPNFVMDNSVMEYIQEFDKRMAVSLIYSSVDKSSLPDNIKTVLIMEGQEYATLLLDSGVLVEEEISLEQSENIDVEFMARRLAALKHIKGISSRIPDSVSFFDMYKVSQPSQLNILQRWNNSKIYKSMAVPLGFRAEDDIVYLNLHEKAHGPHGLVAGTTGSGKSEILQSLILSLAVNFHPYDIGFLLIDYKGGGMANLFSNLPHLLGTITNLDGSESLRALASIKSELSRRQTIFNEAEVNNINDYTKLFKAGKVIKPLPHLLIISDEFAQLKQEQPDFMTELVSTARIGRSLGVHLILATQKPSGVVNEQIWSNSKFKLALKVQDTSDSKEIIKTEDAAHITQAGRAYLQVGNNEIYELFQSAWSGATYNVDASEQVFDDRIYIQNIMGQNILINDNTGEKDIKLDKLSTELDVTVEYIRDLYDGLKLEDVERPWLAPLPEELINPCITDFINTPFNTGTIENYNLSAAVGMIDIPDKQSQLEYIHNFADEGHLAIFASQGFGKSTALMNIAMDLAVKNSSEKLHYYILDFGNSGLIQLKRLDHTADYMAFDDNEKLNKLLPLIDNEMKSRKKLFAKNSAMNFNMYNEVSIEKLPAIIIFIDNFDLIKEIDIDLESWINRLGRDGASLGIYMIISASRSGVLRYSSLNNFKSKIALFMVEASEANSLIGRSKYRVSEIRGRALVNKEDINIMQIYKAVEGSLISYTRGIAALIETINTYNSAEIPKAIRIMPELLSLADLEFNNKPDQKYVAIGIGTEDIEVKYLDLSVPVHVVVGSSQSGKTNMLKLIYTQVKDKKVYMADIRGGDLSAVDLSERTLVMYNSESADVWIDSLNEELAKREEGYAALESTKRLKDYVKELDNIVVLIDDADNFIDMVKHRKADVERLFIKSLDYGVSIIATTVPSKLKGYDELTKLFRGSSSAIILGSPDEQSLFRMPIIRNYKPAVDTGFINNRQGVVKIRIPNIM